MKTEEKNKTRKVTVRFTPSEYIKLEASFKKTTKTKLSEYVRAVLLERPVTVYTRSKSLDDLVGVLVSLKGELSHIGHNFNQAVKRLHSMDKNWEVKMWAEWNEKSKEILLQKVGEIHQKIAYISEVWLRE